MLCYGIVTGKHFNNMFCSDIGRGWWLLAIGILGSIAVISAVQADTIFEKTQCLKWLGRNSLFIYGFHYYFLDFWQAYVEANFVEIGVELKFFLDVTGTAVLLVGSICLILIRTQVVKIIVFVKERIQFNHKKI